VRMADIIKSYNDVARRNVDMLDGTYSEVITSISQNMTNKFREAFESYDPVNGGKWTESKASGDLVYVDGNALLLSYLVISKDPLTAGTETAITSIGRVSLPIEAAIGASMSQRTLGQEFSIEMVDTGAPLPDVSDIEISAISQATTVLTIDTVTPHGLSVGKSIGVRDCSNLLANYPALVVATVVTPNQFTATAGPGGTIASQTITNPAGAKGFVYFRERLGRAQNGIAQIFEQATVTQASLYIRSEAGDALPSGTIAGNHSVTVGTTASVQLVNVAYQYAFSPTTEYRLFVQADRTQWADGAVDAVAQTTSRLLRTQVCPDPSATYKVRIRCTNNKSLTVPNAQIVSAVKTGTTTATITTDRPHGLVATDPVVVYGIRAQGATEFPNLLTATAVASVVDSVTFTIVIGTAGTVTSYGGYVAKVQGGNLMSALGANAVVAQAVTLSTLADGTRQLLVTGNTNWAGLSIGDLVNLVGVRDNTTGATLGVDGAWKVANSATTSLTLVLPYAGSLTLPADFGATNCGGGVIKRTDLRISFVRVFDYERERVELLARPSGDLGAAVPVAIQGGTVTTVSTVTSAGVAGTTANNATTVPNPVLTSIVGVSANPAAGTTARQQQAIGTLIGVPVTKPYSIPEGEWSYAAAAAGILNTTTAVTIKAVGGAGIRNYITSIQVMAETLTTATELAIRDGAAGTVIWRTKIPTTGLSTTTIYFPNPLKGTANTLLEVVTLTASGAGAVYFNAQGYAAP
jgi:hypothetical protein